MVRVKRAANANAVRRRMKPGTALIGSWHRQWRFPGIIAIIDANGTRHPFYTADVARHPQSHATPTRPSYHSMPPPSERLIPATIKLLPQTYPLIQNCRIARE